MLLTLGVGVAAVNTANNLLFLVLGLLLSVVLTSGVLSDLVLLRLRVTRLAPPRVFADTPALFALHVTNAKTHLRSMSFSLLDHREGGGHASAYVLELAAGETKEVFVEHVFPRRGRVRLEALEVRTRYPFDLIDKGDRREAPVELVVYPRLLDAAHAPARAGALGESALASVGEGGEPFGIRELREGESVRDVHALRSASLARLVRHERIAEGRRSTELSIETRVDVEDPLALARFERSISEAATLVLARVPRGETVVIRTSDALLGEVTRPVEIDDALTALALLEPTLRVERSEARER